MPVLAIGIACSNTTEEKGQGDAADNGSVSEEDGESENAADSVGDEDSDVDIAEDNDSDADSAEDSESDSDSDGTSDSDTDSDGDDDSDAAADSDSDSDLDSNGDTENAAATDTDTDSNADGDTGRETTEDEDTDTLSSTGHDGAITVSNLTIDPNPNSVLSVWVNWTTEDAADSEVQFGVDAVQFRIYDASPVTEHRVLVIGMHAETTYVIKAVSRNDDGTGEAQDTYTTEALPTFVPDGVLMADNTDRSQPGWTLINVVVGTGSEFPSSDYPASAVMYDHDGHPVWYLQHGTEPDQGGATSMDFLPESNTILMGPTNAEPAREVDLAGNILWESTGPRSEEDGGVLSHHVGKLSNGNYLLLRWVGEEYLEAGSATRSPVPPSTRIEEVTPENEMVWFINLFDHIDVPEEVTGDWCHGNAASVSIEKDEAYISSRFLGLFKFTYHNPTLVWHMPATYNASEMGDISFSPAAAQFTDIHDPEIHDDGTILFFDNGGYAAMSFGVPGQEPPPDETFHSRILEFTVDDATKEAALSFEFPGNFSNVDPWFTDDFYLPFWGDADRLDNGNVLVAAGRMGPGIISHIFEVATDDGEVVWDLTLPEDHGVYRAQRIPIPPLVEPIQ